MPEAIISDHNLIPLAEATVSEIPGSSINAQHPQNKVEEVMSSILNPNAKPFIPLSKRNIARSAISDINPNANNSLPLIENVTLINSEVGNATFRTDDLHHRTDPLSNTISYKDKDVYSRLKEIRLKNSNRIVIAHLNINSLRNKFDMLSDLIYGIYVLI